jgi:hypothetical protein
VKDADGTGEDQVLFASEMGRSVTDWSADGQYVLFNDFALPLGAERKLVPLPQVRQQRVSPDGRWLAYSSTESGRLEIYVQRFSELLAGESTGKRQASTGGGSYPEWRRDARRSST